MVKCNLTHSTTAFMIFLPRLVALMRGHYISASNLLLIDPSIAYLTIIVMSSNENNVCTFFWQLCPNGFSSRLTVSIFLRRNAMSFLIGSIRASSSCNINLYLLDSHLLHHTMQICW